jgi:hypothetical protein
MTLISTPASSRCTVVWRRTCGETRRGGHSFESGFDLDELEPPQLGRVFAGEIQHLVAERKTLGRHE